VKPVPFKIHTVLSGVEMIIDFFENKRLNTAANVLLSITFLGVLAGWYWASGVNSERAATIVKTEAAGEISSVAVSAGSSGMMFRGMGVINPEFITVVTTDRGVFALAGSISIMKSNPLRIETRRDGGKQLCQGSSCYPVAIPE
jgi:hypothetical protein